MKKNVLIAAALTACLAMGGLVAGCSPSDGESENEGANNAQVEASADSVLGYHATLNQDLSGVAEVSVASCTSETACHGGSWESVVTETVDMFTGIGQIPDANPHEAHATNGYDCGDCHSLTGTSVNQCNGCHNFETPSTWVDKDPTTTIYGPAQDTPLY